MQDFERFWASKLSRYFSVFAVITHYMRDFYLQIVNSCIFKVWFTDTLAVNMLNVLLITPISTYFTKWRQALFKILYFKDDLILYVQTV